MVLAMGVSRFLVNPTQVTCHHGTSSDSCDVRLFFFFFSRSRRVHHQVNGRIISKQIHVRVEHVSPSKCRDEMKRRVKENEAAKKAAREGGGQSRHVFFFVSRGFFLFCVSCWLVLVDGLLLLQLCEAGNTEKWRPAWSEDKARK